MKPHGCWLESVVWLGHLAGCSRCSLSGAVCPPGYAMYFWLCNEPRVVARQLEAIRAGSVCCSFWAVKRDGSSCYSVLGGLGQLVLCCSGSGRAVGRAVRPGWFVLFGTASQCRVRQAGCRRRTRCQRGVRKRCSVASWSLTRPVLKHGPRSSACRRV